MLSTTDDVARLRADEAVEGGGDAWRVVDFEPRVEGIALRGYGRQWVIDGGGNGGKWEPCFHTP